MELHSTLSSMTSGPLTPPMVLYLSRGWRTVFGVREVCSSDAMVQCVRVDGDGE